MSLTKADQELIDKYLDRSLKEDEELIFDQKIKNSIAFAEEVELHETMLAAIRIRDKQALRDELKGEALKLRQKSSKKLSRTFFYLAAASIMILAMLTYMLLPSHNSLFNEYYVPIPESPIVRTEIESINNYQLAMGAYSKGQFQNALQLFNKVDDTAIRHEIELYKGNCHLGLDQPEQAISQFQLALASSNEQIIFQAQWFLALAHLKNGDKMGAIEILQQMREGNHPYKEKSESLINKLDWTLY